MTKRLKAVNVGILPGLTAAPPLTKGEIYELQDTLVCSCGSTHYDVGLVSEYNYVRCLECKQDLKDGDKIHWAHPSRFIEV